MKTSLNKILIFFTIALLITNVVLVYFLWNNKKHYSGRHKGGERGDWMVNELKLDDKQKAEHKKLKEAHFASLKPIFDSITAERSRLYNLLKEPVINDSLVSYYVKAIGDKHSLVSEYTFEHFKTMRAICTAEQKIKLDQIIQKIVKHMGGKEARSKP
ncbi:MAG: hypothetical protein ABIU11_01820 [Chitinophagaceae bacterium]